MQPPLRWLLLAGYSIALAVASLAPASDLPSVQFPYLDKIIHFGMYAGLMLLLMRAMKIKPAHAARSVIVALSVCIAYGVLLECGQLLLTKIAGRTFSVADIAANTTGAAVATLALTLRRKSSVSELTLNLLKKR